MGFPEGPNARESFEVEMLKRKKAETRARPSTKSSICSVYIPREIFGSICRGRFPRFLDR
jgi:hypothetical protein